MTQEEIRAEYQSRKDKISELRGEIEIEQAYLGVLRKRCKHPEAYTYYAMGEPGIRCPDCGHST